MYLKKIPSALASQGYYQSLKQKIIRYYNLQNIQSVSNTNLFLIICIKKNCLQ